MTICLISTFGQAQTSTSPPSVPTTLHLEIDDHDVGYVDETHRTFRYVQLHFEWTLKRILSYYHVSVDTTKNPANPSPVAIKIRASSDRSLVRNWSYWNKLYGELTITLPGQGSQKFEFHQSFLNGPTITENLGYIDNAKKDLQFHFWHPDDLWDTAFIDVLAKAILQIYGPDGFIAAMHDKDRNIKYYAVRTLRRGKEKKATGPMIDLIKILREPANVDFDSFSRKAQNALIDERLKRDFEITVVDALREITGQYLAYNYQVWHDWWLTH